MVDNRSYIETQPFYTTHWPDHLHSVPVRQCRSQHCKHYPQTWKCFPLSPLLQLFHTVRWSTKLTQYSIYLKKINWNWPVDAMAGVSYLNRLVPELFRHLGLKEVFSFGLHSCQQADRQHQNCWCFVEHFPRTFYHQPSSCTVSKCRVVNVW